MTTIILTYYEKRRKYLPGIIEALQKSTVKTDIIVFNQGRPIDDIPGVTVINSGRNFGCSVRHALAMCIDDDPFFFQDDDLMVIPDTIERLAKYLNDDNVVGISGSILTDGYYITATPVSNRFSMVSIVTGRVHLCRKKAIIKAFKLRDRLKLKIFREDDILLSLANNINFVVDSPIINLDEEGTGLSYDPEHYSDRNKICKTIYEAITSGKY